MSVYFALVGPYIKVGFSGNPERRVRRLFASGTTYTCPADTPKDLASRTLLKVIPGTLDTEAAIHRALDDFRVDGEWFADEPAVRDFIASVEWCRTYEPVVRDGGSILPDIQPLHPLDAYYSARLWRSA